MISAAEPLHTTAVEVDLGDTGLLGLLPHVDPSGAWIRQGHGLIGLGEAVSTTASGHRRFADLASFWSGLTFHGSDWPEPSLHWSDDWSLSATNGAGTASYAVETDHTAPGGGAEPMAEAGSQAVPGAGSEAAAEAGSGPVAEAGPEPAEGDAEPVAEADPGCTPEDVDAPDPIRRSEHPPGPTAFVSIAYSPDSHYASRLTVPQLLISADETGAMLTVITDDGNPDLPSLLHQHGLVLDGRTLQAAACSPPDTPQAKVLPGISSEEDYLKGVTAALSAIDQRTVANQDAVEKLVLARDVLVETDSPLSTGPLLARLAADYPQTWSYLVGDVLGATPEMLVRIRGEQVSSRVLAGTVDHQLAADEAAEQLLRNAKQHREHDLAVASLMDQLSPVTESLQAPTDPRVLELPNVYHLATDVTGVLARQKDGQLPAPLTVAGHAHPTAAVCGTPTAQADQLLARLERLDRGPFAGPVGWMDTRGNADFGIALRGGVVETPSTVRLFAGCGIVAGSEPEAELAETHTKFQVMLQALQAR